jgi:hypothetical protein
MPFLSVVQDHFSPETISRVFSPTAGVNILGRHFVVDSLRAAPTVRIQYCWIKHASIVN